MRFAAAAAIAALFTFFCGCSAVTPRGAVESRNLLKEVVAAGAETYLPDEFRSFSDALAMGERSLREDDEEGAQRNFDLALLKGELLRRDLAAEKLKREEATLRLAEAEIKEKERLAEEERRRLLEEQQRKEDARKKAEASHPAKEKPLPANHTVRRGETLLEISARVDIYGDPQLWPLIYRANRDQIKDPKSLSAGQVLRIPRNVPREELSEARRYAHDKPLF